MSSHHQTPHSLDTALAFHQAGNLEQAAVLYRQILAQHPGQADALYLLGVLHHQLGQHEEAVDLILKAIEKNRRNPDWFNTLGEAYRGLGRLDDAVQAYRRALKIEPRLVPALGNLGRTLHDQGKLDAAAQCYERVLRLAPSSIQALVNLGAVDQDRGRDAEATAIYRRVLELDKNNVDAHFNLALLLEKDRQWDLAQTQYEIATHLAPERVDAHFNLGLLLQEKRQWDQARFHFEIATRLAPERADVWFALGRVWNKLTRADYAISTFEEALRLRPDYPEAHHYLAMSLARCGRHDDARRHFESVISLCQTAVEREAPSAPIYKLMGDAFDEIGQRVEAETAYRCSLELQPDYVDALINLTNVLVSQRRFSEAEGLLDHALTLSPDAALLHRNKGILLSRLGRPSEAFQSFERSLSLAPDAPEAHVNYALSLLRYGCFDHAWREYEYVGQQTYGLEYIQDPRDPTRLMSKPSTLVPMDFRGKRLLFVFSQGIGDEIFFLRFMQALRNNGAWVAYQPSAKLVDILDRVGAVDEIVRAPNFPLSLDHIFSVSDAPLVAGMKSAKDIPPPLPIAPLPSHIEVIGKRLAEVGPGPYLGVTWRGGTERQPGETARLLKDVKLEALARAVSGWPGTVLALQRNPKPGEVETFSRHLGREIHDFSQVNEDLEAMMALLKLIDDYVGVSNANMHLRAGLGLTAKVLVPEPAEWRWMARGNESPWFPGFKLYRESMNGGWEQAMASLASDIAQPPKHSSFPPV